MSLLDRAASRLGFVRQDSAPPTPASSPAPAPERQHRQWRGDDFQGVLGAYAGRLQYGGTSTTLYAPEELYASDGIASAIVDRPAEDAVSRWFRIEGDERDDILGELDRLDAVQALTDAVRWARLTGASAIMPLVDDGQPLDAPLDLGRVRSVTDIMVHSSAAITMRAERYSDPSLPNYGLPTHYDIRPRYGMTFPVHETRLFPVSGDPLPYSAAQNARLPWMGRGVLDGCYADLCRYRETLRIAKLILERKQQPVHLLSGLGEMLSAGLDDIVAKRLETADLARNILTTVCVDADDDFRVLDSSLSGIRDMIQESKIAVCSSAGGIPLIVLFSEQPGGLNSTGAGQHESYHQLLRREQSRLQLAAERLVGLLYAQQSFRNREPQSWNLRWEPLWSPTDAEVAATAKTQAEAKKGAVEAIASLVKSGLATPDEGRQLVREQIYETLSTDALPEEDDEQPQAEIEGARKAGAEAIVVLIDGGLITPDHGRQLAQRLFPDLPDGPAPEPLPELLPTDTDPETAPTTATAEEPIESAPSNQQA
jgi:uncharacterized protein